MILFWFSEQINEIKGLKWTFYRRKVYVLKWMKTIFWCRLKISSILILDPFLSSLDWKINWNLFAVGENSFSFFRVLVFISYRTSSNRILNCTLFDCPRVWCLSNLSLPHKRNLFSIFVVCFEQEKWNVFFVRTHCFFPIRYKKSCKI